MGQTFGLQTLTPVVGNGLQLLANLDEVQWKSGGITLDWATVTAVSGSDVTLPDGIVVKIGYKGLRYGQVLVQITSGGSSGKFGPYDSTATDGRQTLTPGRVFLLNQTILESGLVPTLGSTASNHTGGFDAGLVWTARLLDSTQTNPLAPAGPTLAALATALPRISYVDR